MQGGFRAGKTTYTKIWTLVNLIEDANNNNKPLHLCYIDVKKAYDSVEHWGIKKLLTQYKFHPDFIKLICNIYENNTCGFNTPYGLTDAVPITHGVRQGCPLSPVLFVLFLDPMLLWLEDKRFGYPVNNVNVAGGAYADDIVLTASSHYDMQTMFSMVVDYYDYFGLEISIHQKQKTVYTSNNGNKKSKIILYKGKEVTWMEPEESYKYLGVWINLKLD